MLKRSWKSALLVYRLAFVVCIMGIIWSLPWITVFAAKAEYGNVGWMILAVVFYGVAMKYVIKKINYVKFRIMMENSGL